MKMHGNPTDVSDARFDAAMRAIHGAAVRSVSPSLRRKLRPAARVAAAPPPRPGRDWRSGLAFAGAAAALCALAIGLGLRSPADVGTAPQQVAVLDDGADATGVLAQDPEFYAWLASDDAELVAVE